MIVAGRRAQRRTTFENRYAFLPLPLSIHHSFDVVVGYYSSRRKKKKQLPVNIRSHMKLPGK
jgi:hypothetical protein